MEQTGDCEDDTILAAAILKRVGFEVALLIYPEHCALGVAGADGLPGNFVHEKKSRLKYYYGESTAKGWQIGEVPMSLRNIKPKNILPIYRLAG